MSALVGIGRRGGGGDRTVCVLGGSREIVIQPLPRNSCPQHTTLTENSRGESLWKESTRQPPPQPSPHTHTHTAQDVQQLTSVTVFCILGTSTTIIREAGLSCQCVHAVQIALWDRVPVRICNAFFSEFAMFLVKNFKVWYLWMEELVEQ